MASITSTLDILVVFFFVFRCGSSTSNGVVERKIGSAGADWEFWDGDGGECRECVSLVLGVLSRADCRTVQSESLAASTEAL